MPAVQPEKLLKELSELWVGLGEKDDAGHGVLRACAMTFLVVTERDTAGVDVGETLASLMPEHPSRAVVVVLDDEAVEISARVFAQCWMPFGRRQQICCEQIEITTPPDRLADIATVILGLVVPDLPVVMWSRCAGLFDLPEYHRLLPLMDKLIVDSNRVEDAAAFLRHLKAIPRVLVADLAWTRLTRWRETVAAVFENRAFLDRLGTVDEISVSYAGAEEPTRAWYLAAWLARGVGGRVKPVLRKTDGEPGVHGVSLKGGDFAMSLVLVDESQAELRAGGLVTRLVFQRPDDYRLLREELKILGSDRIFEESLAGAIELSGSA